LTTSRLYELRGELFDADEIRSFYQDDIVNLDAEQRAEILRELVALGICDHRCASVRSLESVLKSARSQVVANGGTVSAPRQLLSKSAG
jgi:hypothetical protein